MVSINSTNKVSWHQIKDLGKLIGVLGLIIKKKNNLYWVKLIDWISILSIKNIPKLVLIDTLPSYYSNLTRKPLKTPKIKEIT